MNLSLGEFQAAAAKALRGAGYSWGMAAEGAGACRTLASMGYDPSHSLLRLLLAVEEMGVDAVRPDDTWATASGRICPLSAGAAMSDAPPTGPLALANVIEPLLLIPTLAVLASDDSGFAMRWDGGSVVIGVDGPDGWGVPPIAEIAIEPAAAPPARAGRATRVDIRNAALEELNRFAHRTYAPSTDASRAAGAGAGLNDND